MTEELSPPSVDYVLPNENFPFPHFVSKISGEQPGTECLTNLFDPFSYDGKSPVEPGIALALEPFFHAAMNAGYFVGLNRGSYIEICKAYGLNGSFFPSELSRPVAYGYLIRKEIDGEAICFPSYRALSASLFREKPVKKS
ncbi:hypothetical protein HYU14_06865 [Candidatus Woesearchaeota archaeon]|nr:hypothetical protein [Candidatus Woesearchaeota archaeon]